MSSTAKSSMASYSELFRQPESFTLPLLGAFLEANGLEALEWEPETIRLEIKADFGVDPTQLVMDKIQAGMALLTTDQFYTYFESFEETVNVLNDSEADFTILRPPTPEELAWAVVEAHLIDEPEEPLTKMFSPEIKQYVGQVLHDAGLYRPSEFLPFVKCLCDHDPEQEHAGLRDEIRTLHTVKQQRIRIYVVSRFDALKEQIRRFFPGKPTPDLESLLRSETFA